MDAVLHGLVQMWDELVSGLGQIQTSPEGLDVVSASGPWDSAAQTLCLRPLLHFLLQSHPSQTACRRVGVGHQVWAGDWVKPGCSGPFPPFRAWVQPSWGARCGVLGFGHGMGRGTGTGEE